MSDVKTGEGISRQALDGSLILEGSRTGTTDITLREPSSSEAPIVEHKWPGRYRLTVSDMEEVRCHPVSSRPPKNFEFVHVYV